MATIPFSHTTPNPSTAMSDTNSGPAQWTHLGGGWQHLQPSASAPGVSDSVAVSTMSSTTVDGPAKGVTATQPPGIEGRVGKPVRRRSRASRRAPTTMLNTDTANFRSMVQQFTGIPSGLYSAGYRPGATGGAISNIGYSFNEPIHPTNLVSFGQFQQHQDQAQNHHQSQQQQQQQQQQFYRSSDHAVFTRATGGNNNSNDAFLQGFSNSGTNLEAAADGFFFDGMYNQMMPRPASTNNSGEGYFS